MVSANGRASGVEVIGIRLADLEAVPLVAHPETAPATSRDLGQGIAIGSGVARDLGVGVGDVVTLISPEGMDTPFGTQPRVNDYQVVYVFGVGRYDIDKTRVYMPFDEAQSFFDREGGADEIEVMVDDPDRVEAMEPALAAAAGPRAALELARRLGRLPPGARRRAARHVHHPLDGGADRRRSTSSPAWSCW